MKDFDFKKILPYVYGGLLVLCGILVVAVPAFWIKFFVVIFGLGAIAYGIYEITQLNSIPTEAEKFKKSLTMKACVSIVFGILSVIIPIAVASTAWKIIVYFFAIGLIVTAALGFYSVSVLNGKSPKRKQFIIENSVILIVAILLFLISPEKLGTAIIRIIGIAAILAGLLWITVTAITKGSSKDIVVAAETVVVEDESVEADKIDENKTEE